MCESGETIATPECGTMVTTVTVTVMTMRDKEEQQRGYVQIATHENSTRNKAQHRHASSRAVSRRVSRRSVGVALVGERPRMRMTDDDDAAGAPGARADARHRGAVQSCDCGVDWRDSPTGPAPSRRAQRCGQTTAPSGLVRAPRRGRQELHEPARELRRRRGQHAPAHEIVRRGAARIVGVGVRDHPASLRDQERAGRDIPAACGRERARARARRGSARADGAGPSGPSARRASTHRRSRPRRSRPGGRTRRPRDSSRPPRTRARTARAPRAPAAAR